MSKAASRLPDLLWHGTSTRFLDQILRDGLEPCHMTGEVLMGCYTDDPAVAIHHAVCMASMEAAEPVLFRLPIVRFREEAFVLDDKFVELCPSAGRGVYACEMMGEEAWMEAPWTWRSMLRIGGSVGYTGTVPVSAADLVRHVAWPSWMDLDDIREPIAIYRVPQEPAGRLAIAA